MKDRGMLTTAVFVTLLLVISTIFLCPMDITPIENIYAKEINNYTNINKIDKHPKIESVLYQLAQSQSPNEFANAHGIHLDDGKVRVTIELKNETDQIAAEFNVTTISADNNFVRAFVPINELINLADEPYIVFIRTPLESYHYPAETPIPFSDFKLIMLFLIGIVVVACIVFILKRYRGD